MTLSGAVLTSDSTVSVTGIVASDNVPYVSQFDIQIDNEVMTVVSNNASTFSVLRGQRGTVVAAHASGATITNVTGKTAVYAKTFTDSRGEVIQLDSSLTVDGTGLLGVQDKLITDTDGTTVTFDRSLGRIHKIVLGGSRTFVFSNMAIGKDMVLLVTQDGTGSRTVTWPSNLRWAGGSAPTLTTAANKIDVVTVRQITSTPHYLASVSQNY